MNLCKSARVSLQNTKTSSMYLRHHRMWWRYIERDSSENSSHTPRCRFALLGEHVVPMAHPAPGGAGKNKYIVCQKKCRGMAWTWERTDMLLIGSRGKPDLTPKTDFLTGYGRHIKKKTKILL